MKVEVRGVEVEWPAVEGAVAYSVWAEAGPDYDRLPALAMALLAVLRFLERILPWRFLHRVADAIERKAPTKWVHLVTIPAGPAELPQP